MTDLLSNLSSLSELKTIVLTDLLHLSDSFANSEVPMETLRTRSGADQATILDLLETLVSRGYVTISSQRQSVKLTAAGARAIQERVSGVSDRYHSLLRKALAAKQKIEVGFIELAESVHDIHQDRLYRSRYSTFQEFCEEELGFSRQTVYVYLAILRLISSYPQYLPRDRAIQFGHKKMRYITEGINNIDRKIKSKDRREKKKKQILSKVQPEMPSSEIRVIVDQTLKKG